MRLSSTLRGWSVPVAGMILLIAAFGCESGTGDTATDTSPTMSARGQRELLDAIAQTRDSTSFRITPVLPAGDTADDPSPFDEMSVDYVAPDRTRSLSTLPSGQLELVDVGSAVYINVANQPGTYMQWPAEDATSSPGDIRGALDELFEAVEAAEVSQAQEADNQFLLEIPAGAFGDDGLKGEATVEGGHLVSLRLTIAATGDNYGHYAFSMFDTVPPIEAPSGAHLVPYDPELFPAGFRPCEPDGQLPPGETFCNFMLPGRTSTSNGG